MGRHVRGIVLGLLGVLGAACRAPGFAQSPAVSAVVQRGSGAGTDTAAWVDSVLATLNTRQRVAQMVMFWALGDYASADDSSFREVVRWVEQEGVGGLVISLGTPIEVAEKLNYLQRRARIPLLVASDLEPGMLRLEGAVFPHYLLETGGGTAFPSAMAVAATGRDEDAYDVGRALAREARAVGIHVNFAPVVDVNINPRNPVIGTRSFGEDPRRVARLTELFIRGTHDGGALATAKHFPGHGDTDVDSHVGLPVVHANAARLDSVELVPFRAAIRAGTDLVMSAHVALPAFGGDSATPATLRPDIMRSLLRDSLGFTGITVTDALNMEGVGRGYTIEESVVAAAQAGSDILLRPGDDVTRAINAVVAALQRGDVRRASVDQSVRRLLWAKARVGLFQRREVSLDSLRRIVGTAAHRRLAQDVAQRAITLVRDSGLALPIPRSARTAIVSYRPETEIRAGKALVREMTRSLATAPTAFVISPASAATHLDSVANAIRGADAIVLAAFVRRVEGEGRTTVPPHVAAWIDSVAASRNAALIAFGNPYVVRQVPRARTFLNAYSVSDPSEIAAARALIGLAPIVGESPVTLKQGTGNRE